MANKGMAFEHIFQSAATATGNGTAMDVGGLAAVGIQAAGITTATITWEATIDDTNWVAVRATGYGNATAATTATANGLYLLPCLGLSQVRARISAYTSGTITVTGKGVFAPAGLI